MPAPRPSTAASATADDLAPVDLATRRLRRIAARAHADWTQLPGRPALTGPSSFADRTGFGPILRPLLDATVDAVVGDREPVRAVASRLGRDPEVAPALPGYLIALHHAAREAGDRPFAALPRAARARLLLEQCAGPEMVTWEALLGVVWEAARTEALTGAPDPTGPVSTGGTGAEVIPFPPRRPRRRWGQTNRAR